MPYHKFSLPVSATNISVKKDGDTYPILLDTDTFDRAGEDGDIPIIPICGGDEFVGESLEGQWHRAWDSDIDTFTATISAGSLSMTGVAAIAGTEGSGWINNFHPAPLVDELEVTVSMEVPVDDTVAVADRDIRFDFLLHLDKDETGPAGDDNYLRIYTDVDETGLILIISKKIAGAVTTLDSGFDYTMDATRDVGDLEGTIWRIVFNGKPGTDGATMNVYLKQDATIALAESATENELDNSPYDISDLAFNVAYPAFRIWTQNTTYFGTTFDSGNRAASTYLRFEYPSQFNVNYDWVEADYGETDVQLWDGDPDTTGVRVYDEDHEFNGDVYLKNGLIQSVLDELAINGLDFYYYKTSTSAYVNMSLQNYFTHDVSDVLIYFELLNIVYLSPEKIILKIRSHDSATPDNDIYIDFYLTLNRGAYTIEIAPTEIYPQTTSFWITAPSPAPRFGYAGDGAVGEDDLDLDGLNSTLTDNFLVQEDNDGELVLITTSVNVKPDDTPASFRAIQGRLVYVLDWLNTTLLSLKLNIGYTPFPLVANLFIEAEDATTTGTIEDPDATASDLKSVKLDAQNEVVYYDITAGTDLPAGTYLAVYRARDTNQVADDLHIWVTNTADAEYRNEEGAVVVHTVTATYAYYSIFFYISDADVTGTDNIRIRAMKGTADANDLFVDYFLIVPIGDGMNWPQDLAHSALRGITQHPRLCER